MIVEIMSSLFFIFFRNGFRRSLEKTKKYINQMFNMSCSQAKMKLSQFRCLFPFIFYHLCKQLILFNEIIIKQAYNQMGNSDSSAIALQYENPIRTSIQSQQIDDQCEDQQLTSICQKIDKLQSYVNFQASKRKFMQKMYKSTPAEANQIEFKSLDLNNFPDLTELQSKRRFSEAIEKNKQNIIDIDKELIKNAAIGSLEFLKFIKEECVYDYYTVLQKIKKGERGQIYKVEKNEIEKAKILKITSKVTFKEKALIKGISQIQNLLKLSHPHVVQLEDAYQDINKYYIIFQKAEGVSLVDYMKKHKISEEVGKQIIRQLLEALQYIHNNGIIHRNIKLENVMIDHSKENAPPEVKLIDFGMSLTIEEAIREKQTHGSIFYAPPQSLEHKINTKYDIWSVGVLTLILFWNSDPSRFLESNYLHELLKRGETFKQNLKKLPIHIKQFIYELLTLKNKRRPTAAEALKMEWISGTKGLYKSRIRKGVDIDEELSNRP